MKSGIENEFDFVMMLNNKKIYELDINSQEMIHSIFNNITDDKIIKVWRNHLKQKTDIMIKIDNIIKGISIKKGSRNSVHVEPISTFIAFLRENEVSEEIIEKYLKYHYADGTLNGKGKNRLSSYEYKCYYFDEINLINDYFNNKKLLEKAIDRFVLKGTNSLYEIDVLCVGEAKDYLWVTKNEIKNILLNPNILETTGIHFGSLYVQPQTRNLNYNNKYELKRHCVQIKWYSLLDDIIIYKYEKNKT